jgi:hypothetical protein
VGRLAVNQISDEFGGESRTSHKQALAHAEIWLGFVELEGQGSAWKWTKRNPFIAGVR